MAFALNRLSPAKLSYTVPQDDLSAVVGIHWLAATSGLQRVSLNFLSLHIHLAHAFLQVPLVGPSVKDGDRWQTPLQAYQYQNIAHPFEGRSALLAITRSNHLKLIYQQPSQPWSEAILELGELTSSSDVITHAAFGDALSQILLVTYDASKCLRLYRVHILWNPVQGDPSHGQPPSVNPVLRVSHIQLLDLVLPQTPSAAELSSILIQPPTVGAEKGHVQVSALFNCLPDDQQIGNQADGRGSVVARWELRQSEVVLHEVFKSLKPGTEKLTASKPRETLQRLGDVSSPKIYLAVTDNLYHNTLAFTCSDGTVDFRHRHSMEIITPDADSNKVSSLPQAGFSFMPIECTDMTLSPCGCVAAVAKQDGTLDVHIAEYIHGWTNAKADHFLPQAAVVALAREAGILFCHNLHSDDLLALIPTDLDRGLRRRFIAEVLRTVSKNTDYTAEDASKEKAKVMKDTILFKLLSMQLVLGYDTNPAIRDIPSKLAWAMLNLRSLNSNIMSSLSLNAGVHTADVMLSLKGLAKWHFDLMHMLINDLFTILRAHQSSISSTDQKDQSPAKITKDVILQQIAANDNTPSVHILFHSASRHLLRFLADIIRHYFQRAIASKSTARDLSQRAGFAEIENLISNHLAFKLPVFEQLLLEIDTGVRKAYADAGVDARARSQAEQAMLVEGVLPDALMPVLEGLFERQVPKLRERVDEVKIFLADTRWLGFGSNVLTTGTSGGGKGVRGKMVDIIRKVEVRDEKGGRGFRRCRRCGSRVEDLWEERGLMPWVMQSQRACVCLCLWVV